MALTVLRPLPAHASFLQGEALDKAADIMSWVVLLIVPIVGIAVFWLLHIMPEKIAEKKRHPQAKAIQCLCLLSLFFGGLLWPIAWLWAYSKPVLHKLAYGTDVDESHGHPSKEELEIQGLRARVAELESAISPAEGKA
jgi:CBS domain containing-hemolysin-like protein